MVTAGCSGAFADAEPALKVDSFKVTETDLVSLPEEGLASKEEAEPVNAVMTSALTVLNPKASDTLKLELYQARLDQDQDRSEKGLFRYKIPEDGNCLFRAVSSQVLGAQLHAELREAAHKWLQGNGKYLLQQHLT